jgi:hypothetical protein
VEVISRVCRVWDEDNIPDPLALDLGENVLKSGVYQFPKSPFARIAYANFLISVKQVGGGCMCGCVGVGACTGGG